MKNPTLAWYRAVAYIVGFGLITLVFVAMPIKYLAKAPEMASVVSPIHGMMYIGYVLLTIALARQNGWTAKRAIGVMLAGTIPFYSFFIERKVVGWIQAAKAEPEERELAPV